MAQETAPKETKAERFVRLATGRVDNATEWLEKLGKLAHQNMYEYTDEQVDKIEQHLTGVLTDNIAQLRSRKAGKSGGISL